MKNFLLLLAGLVLFSTALQAWKTTYVNASVTADNNTAHPGSGYIGFQADVNMTFTEGHLFVSGGSYLTGHPYVIHKPAKGVIDIRNYEYQRIAGTLPPPAGDSILYVDSAAAGSGNGLSWATAFNSLQDALDLASSLDQVKEIWVAKGTYKPTKKAGGGTTDRDKSFAIIPNIKMYGGFAGNEASLDSRDWEANKTLLSGDMGSEGVDSDNVYHVVISIVDVGSALLDGFTISGGNANVYLSDEGGGLLIKNSSPMLTNMIFSGNKAVNGGGIADSNSSPMLTNVTFSGNKASRGSGMFNIAGTPTLNNALFSGNLAGAFGGGMYNGGSTAPVLNKVIFINNQANGSGGGMFNSGSSPILNNVTFSGNSGGGVIGSSGGGMANSGGSPILNNVTFSGNQTGGQGGGMNNQGSAPTLINVTFSGNKGGYGGGMTNKGGSAKLTNVTFTGNSADSLGGAIFNTNKSTSVLINVILWNNQAKGQMGTTSASIFNSTSSANISYSLIAASGGSKAWNDSLGIDGGNNIDTVPGFLKPVNPDEAPTTTGDLKLENSSPVLDKGDPNTDISIFPQDEGGNPVDLAGNPRIFDQSAGGTIDMGAYEYQGPAGTLCPPAGDSILYVDSAAANDGNGVSWASAFNTLQDALDLADTCHQIKQIWVAKGTYKPTKKIVNGLSGYPATARDMAFLLVPNIKIYGGFAGNETSLDSRNWQMNKTVLSGDIGREGDSSDNTYHVVVAVGEVGSALLDGFLITGGNADGFPASFPVKDHDGYFIVPTEGGGVYMSRSSPVFSNITIRKNRAVLYGGAVANEGQEESDQRSSPTFINTVVSGNTVAEAGGGGGGGFFNSESSPVFINTIIQGNSAPKGGGGGMLNFYRSQPVIINTLIADNTAYVGGGVFNSTSGSFVTLINVTLVANQGDSLNGGMYSDSASKIKVYNSIIWNNTAGVNDLGNVYTTSTSTIEFAYSVIQGDYQGDHVLHTSPLFVNGRNDNYSLSPCSPAINAGNNPLYTNAGGDLQKDQDLNNNPRLVGKTIDMGAYEFQGSPAPATRINRQPKDTTVCGRGASFTISATGYQLKYRWQSSKDGKSWAAIAGGTSSTLSISNIQPSDSGTWYRAILTSGCQEKDTSAAATLAVSRAPVITSQPQNQTVMEGESASFGVTATGVTSYQWQSSTDKGTNWGNLTGKTNPTLNLSKVQTADNGNQYRVIVAATCGSVASATATLRVKNSGYCITVNAAPHDMTVCEGSDVSFTISATGASGYRWQSSTDGITWSDMKNETAERLQLSNVHASDSGNRYRVVLNSNCGSITSGPAILHVNATRHTTLNKIICYGSAYRFGGKKISGSGTYYDTLRTTTGCDSTVTLHLTVRPKIETMLNRTVCSGSTYYFGGKEISKSGTYTDTLSSSSGCDSIVILNLQLNTKTTIITQPQNQTICSGSDAVFQVKATGTNLAYQWQSSRNATDWVNITDGTAGTLSLSNMGADQNGMHYRVVINSACAEVTSNTVSLRVDSLPAIIITADQQNPVSKGLIIHLTATGADSYQWAGNPDIQSGLTEASLSVIAKQNGTYTVTGTTVGGCSTSQDYQVTVVSDYKFRIHNIVTPNGDRRNDTWIIENIGSYPENKIRIFDRSGRMIYEREHYDNSWDGTLLGGPLPEGTYYYILTVDHEKKIVKGYFNLIRDE